MIAPSVPAALVHDRPEAPLHRLAARLWASRLDAPALALALDTSVPWASLERFARYDLADPRPVVLCRTQRFEVQVTGWLPGQGTDLEAHPAPSAVRVVVGVASHWRPGERPREVSSGDVVVAGGDEVHQLENAGPEPLVTLQVFGARGPIGRAGPTRRIVILGTGGDDPVRLASIVLRTAWADVHATLVEPDDGPPWSPSLVERVRHLVRRGFGRLRVVRGSVEAVFGQGLQRRRVVLADGRVLHADDLFYGSPEQDPMG